MAETLSTFPPTCLCLEYHWSEMELPGSNTLILSDYISICNHPNAVRLGIKGCVSSHWVQIFCYVNKLEQIGVSMKAVTCTDVKKEVELLKLEENPSVKDISVYTASIKKCSFNHKKPDRRKLIFHFYLVGAVERFVVQNFDSLLGKQLWEAAYEEKYTDIQFFVKDRTFAGHKFLVSARSPVLEAMFRCDMAESRTGVVNIKDVEPEVFEEFLRFLYTGQLTRPVDSNLEMLAEKYLVKTLNAICLQAIPDENEIPLIDDVAASVGDQNQGAISFYEGQISSGRLAEVGPEKMCISRFLETDGRDGTITYALGYGQTFCYSLVGARQQVPFSYELYRFNVHTLRGDSQSFYKVSGVLACVKELHAYQLEFSSSIGNKNIFTTTFYEESLLPSSTSVQVFFKLDCTSSISPLKCQLRDELFSKELWSSVNQELIDIQFEVGDTVFGAHRPVIEARSSVFKEILSKDHSKVPIIQIDPIYADIFEDLLFFIYTGMFKNEDPSARENMLCAAQNYRIFIVTKK